MKRRLWLRGLVLVLVVLLSSVTVAIGAGAARAESGPPPPTRAQLQHRIVNALRCTNGGWQTLVRSDGSRFAGVLSCIVYAAGGSEFGTAVTVAITSVGCNPTALGMVVTGTGFTGVTSVTVNGSPVTYTIDSDTQISIPGVSSGTVVVTTAGGSSATGALPGGSVCGVAPSL